MRTKKTFLFNEEKPAKRLYENGFENGIIDYGQMYLVAKYIRQTNNFGEIRLEKALIDFCKEQDENFNPIKEAEIIKKWLRSAMNYDLRKIESVTVSENEIETLKTITNDRDRKILFVILVLARALKRGNTKRDKKEFRTSEHYYIHYNNFSDIIRLARLNNISEVDLAKILHNYSQWFIFYNPERELLRLNYTDEDRKTIIINDLANMIDYYNILFEKNIYMTRCEKCGIEIKKNSNKQKYCKPCAKEIRRERQKFLMRNRRKKTQIVSK